MHVSQYVWTNRLGWSPALPADADPGVQLALAFGNCREIRRRDLFDSVRRAFPAGIFAGCSTAGEIAGTQAHDDSLVVTAVRLERCTVDSVAVDVLDDGSGAATAVAGALVRPGLRHVLWVTR